MTVEALNQVWPEWQIEEKPLGKGSFGVVYRAVRRDHGVESYAAIKVISIPADSSEVDSLRSEGLDMNATRTYLQSIVNDFVSEIQLMESLKGIQNIVSVEDYRVVEKADEIGWDIYIRMELLTSFNAYICERRLTEGDVINLGWDICTALEICAKRNIIHRDIKPENIFINDFGYFKLGDFGIARKLENLTGGLSQKGTFNYMAPEVANSGEYDARVDTYSLGIVLYRLLNGNRLPFLDTEQQLLNPNERKNAVDRRMRGEELPPPCDASPAMADLILRACAYDPNMRFASATEMKQALSSVANGTYQFRASDPNRTISVREAAGRYDGTTSVWEAPPDQNSAPVVNTFGTAPKKKSKIPAVIAAAVAAVLLVGAGIFVVPKLLDGNDSKNPSESVDYSRSDEKQIVAILSEANAMAAEDDYEGALAKVQAGLVTYPKSAELQEKVDEYTEKLQEQGISSVLHEAERLAFKEDYEGALAKVKDGLTAYPDSVELQNKVDEYTAAMNNQVKAKTLDEAKALADSGDYASAMALIKKAQDTYGEDAEYQNAYETYRQAYNTEIKAEAIATAEELSKQGDYPGAIATINQVITTVGEDAELKERVKTYENAYVTEITAQVDSLLAENDIAAAKALLQDAVKKLPNNETIKSRLDELNKYKTVSLDTLTTINGEFIWNDGLPEDPFESDYSAVKNYTIIHGDWGCDDSSMNSAEYKIDQQYDILQLNISPYSDYRENAASYVQVYVDNVLRYVSPAITQKSGITNVEVDVNGATYLKIVVQKGEYGCIMLSDVVLSCIPNYVSSYEKGITSVATLKPINGGFTWDSGVPTNVLGDSYVDSANYIINHGDWGCDDDSTNSAEYYLSGKYVSLSLDMAPYSEFREDATTVVKIYVDDVLVYTGTLTQKSARTSTGDIDVTNAQYLKIVIEKSEYGCVILSDVLLRNAN